jgi:hypothetical protein
MPLNSRLVACAAVLFGVAALTAGCNPNDRTEHVAVSTTELNGQPVFSVPVINAIAFQKVEIELTNPTGKTRGFAVDDYGISKEIGSGEHVVIRFRADKSGTFRVHDPVDSSAPDARLIVASA